MCKLISKFLFDTSSRVDKGSPAKFKIYFPGHLKVGGCIITYTVGLLTQVNISGFLLCTRAKVVQFWRLSVFFKRPRSFWFENGNCYPHPMLSSILERRLKPRFRNRALKVSNLFYLCDDEQVFKKLVIIWRFFEDKKAFGFSNGIYAACDTIWNTFFCRGVKKSYARK